MAAPTIAVNLTADQAAAVMAALTMYVRGPAGRDRAGAFDALDVAMALDAAMRAPAWRPGPRCG